MDDSSLAVLPVPGVAFFVPNFDLHKISSEPYLHRCGDSTRVVNRDVSVNKTACIHAGLTRIMTLGVWQWCPAYSLLIRTSKSCKEWMYLELSAR